MSTGYIIINVDQRVYIKDPQSSELGRNILKYGLELMDEIGLEEFTFRKLAQVIQSTEASIYRYFDNKQAILHYFVLWYWSWLKYRVTNVCSIVQDPKERLFHVVDVLTTNQSMNDSELQINTGQLFRVILAESQKIYLNKRVDAANKDGFFRPYKELIQQVCKLIQDVAPGYPYPNMLATTMLEGAHLQRFFSEHLPGLTNTDKNKDSVNDFYRSLINKLLF